MDHRKWSVLLHLMLLLGIGSCTKPSRDRPNFIILLIDDLGARDVGCYGQEYIETPNIDRLASQGMRWSSAYSSCPVCSPTRVAILTGRNPARVHFTGHITAIGRHRYPENGRIIPPQDLMHIPLEETTLAEALKPLGYTSASIGKWHVGEEGYWPLDQGFDINIGGWTHGSPPSHFYPYTDPNKEWNPSIPTLHGGKDGEYLTDRLTDEALGFVKANMGRPFLVYLSHYAVHTPLEAPASLIQKYLPLLQGTGIDPVYAAMVDRVDTNIGRLLDSLDSWNLSENTVVFFASDNGGLATVTNNSPFRMGKGHLYEGGLRVPFIVRWPGHITPGSVNECSTISEDIFATILDISKANMKADVRIDGRSLVRDFHLAGPAPDTIALHWYYPHYSPQAKRPGAAIRFGPYKLIEHYDPPGVELYNLTEDIGETNDLSQVMPQRKEMMLGQLHQWLEAVEPIKYTMNPAYTVGE